MHPHYKYREANECASLMAKKVDTRASESKFMINTILLCISDLSVMFGIPW